LELKKLIMRMEEETTEGKRGEEKRNKTRN
jgi:hypothetical protein